MSIISMFCWIPFLFFQMNMTFFLRKRKREKKKATQGGRLDSSHGNYLSNSLYHANYTLLCAISIYKSKVNRQIAENFFLLIFGYSLLLVLSILNSHFISATWIFHAPRNTNLSQDLQHWCQSIAFAVACCQLAYYCRPIAMPIFMRIKLEERAKSKNYNQYETKSAANCCIHIQFRAKPLQYVQLISSFVSLDGIMSHLY